MKMRAKLKVTSVDASSAGQETLRFSAVGGSKVEKGYPADGADEDNDYAKWTPMAELSMTVSNPALHGKFKAGQTFYLDFTPAD